MGMPTVVVVSGGMGMMIGVGRVVHVGVMFVGVRVLVVLVGGMPLGMGVSQFTGGVGMGAVGMGVGRFARGVSRSVLVMARTLPPLDNQVGTNESNHGP